LTEAGQIVRRAWQILPQRFPQICVDENVVMPNHFHGVIQIVGAGLAPPQKGAASSAPTLAAVVRVFKSTSAIAVNALLSRQGRQFWQRNYYEHIIRNDRELELIRDYIRTNPQRWASDPENPGVGDPDKDPWL